MAICRMQARDDNMLPPIECDIRVHIGPDDGLGGEACELHGWVRRTCECIGSSEYRAMSRI
jgi:hypothetical protein